MAAIIEGASYCAATGATVAKASAERLRIIQPRMVDLGGRRMR